MGPFEITDEPGPGDATSPRLPGGEKPRGEGAPGARRTSRGDDSRRGSAVVAFFLLAAFLAAIPVSAQTAEDELGDWLIYNGTLRFSERWSVFTDAQYRLYEVASNPGELLLRAAGQFHLTDRALVALGYARIRVWPFEEIEGQDDGTRENRIYQQFTIAHPWGRAGFEHRYRLEQRWVEQAGDTDYLARARYRLQVTVPLNRPKMEPGAYFLNLYDELFVGLGSTPSYDQNRLYLAAGKQFNRDANLQLGYLWQSRTAADFYRLQIFLTYNFDFRDGR